MSVWVGDFVSLDDVTFLRRKFWTDLAKIWHLAHKRKLSWK